MSGKRTFMYFWEEKVPGFLYHVRSKMVFGIVDYVILILAVDHDEFINKGYSEIESFIKDGGIFLDLNSVFYDYDHKKESILYWSP